MHTASSTQIVLRGEKKYIRKLGEEMTIELTQTPMTLEMDKELGVVKPHQLIVYELGPEASGN